MGTGTGNLSLPPNKVKGAVSQPKSVKDTPGKPVAGAAPKPKTRPNPLGK